MPSNDVIDENRTTIHLTIAHTHTACVCVYVYIVCFGNWWLLVDLLLLVPIQSNGIKRWQRFTLNAGNLFSNFFSVCPQWCVMYVCVLCMLFLIVCTSNGRVPVFEKERNDSFYPLVQKTHSQIHKQTPRNNTNVISQNLLKVIQRTSFFLCDDQNGYSWFCWFFQNLTAFFYPSSVLVFESFCVCFSEL